MLLVHIGVLLIDQDLGRETTPTKIDPRWSLEAEVSTTSTKKARGQALTDLEARRGGIIDVRPRKRGLGDVSRDNRVQEALIASQVSPTIELLRHRDEILLRRCSVRGAWVLSVSDKHWRGRNTENHEHSISGIELQLLLYM
jgi:hypothetical protein